MCTAQNRCFCEADVGALEKRTGLILQKNWTHSWLDEPDTRVARVVRLWLRACDRSFQSQAGMNTPPIWIDELFHEKWGPHQWPVNWADIPTMEKVDCGVLQALTTEVYRMRGTIAHPMQLVLRFNAEAINGWRSLWNQADVEPDWCGHRAAYHEGTLVVDPETSIGRIFDPMGRFFLQPKIPPSYEGIIAFRYQAEASDKTPVMIEGIPAYPGVWYEVPGED